MMKKYRLLLTLPLLLTGCKLSTPPEQCLPIEFPDSQQYTREEKIKMIQSTSSIPFGFKECSTKELCTYKDCNTLGDIQHICDNGQEYGNHYIRELENKNIRLDYGESIYFYLSEADLFSGAEVEIKNLTGVIEIIAEADYLRKEECGQTNIGALDETLRSGDILPPTRSQFILTAGKSIHISKNDLIIYTGLQNGEFAGTYFLKINPIAKENRLAYKIDIPKD